MSDNDELEVLQRARRVLWDDETWYDVTPYLGQLHNFSAKFLRPLGKQVVYGGDEIRPDGRVRRWAFVSGEIQAHHQ